MAGGVSRTYDTDFRVATESVNGGNSVTYQYDPDSLLTGAGALTLTRHAQHGLLIGTTLGNVTDAYTYSTFAELSTYQANYSGSSLLNITYTRDALGRITQKTETIGGTTTTTVYGYDPAGRLTDVTVDGTLTAHYDYDGNGNRLTVTRPGTGTISGTYDAQDRLTTYGAVTYSYSANGDLQTATSGSETTTYSYDVFGNLVSLGLPNGTQIEYVIDGQNRRIGKKVNGTLVQGFLYRNLLAPVAELEGSGTVVSRFVYGTKINVPEYMVKGGAAYRLLTDHLGSVRLVVDTATGTIAQRLDYDEFGQITEDTNPGFQPFGFAGGLYDPDTKLTRFGARDYDAFTGRWTAKDPILFGGGDTNLYRYAFNSPLEWTDPWGLVNATRGGTVSRAGWQNPNNQNAGLGWRVTITAPDGSYDQYGHMDPNTTPAVGTPVSAGDYIGDYADPTNGSSTGPHVHHERRDREGNIINPGNDSPIPGGRRTSGYGEIDSAHPTPHQGNDWVNPSPSRPGGGGTIVDGCIQVR